MRKPKPRTPENTFCYPVALSQRKAVEDSPLANTIPKSMPTSSAADSQLPVNLALEFIPKPRRSPCGVTHHPLLPLHGKVEDVPLEVKGHQRWGTDWRDKQRHELSQQGGMEWENKGQSDCWSWNCRGGSYSLMKKYLCWWL